MWLRDSLPHDLKTVQVLIYGYDSHLANSNSFQDLGAIANSFSSALRAIRYQANVSHLVLKIAKGLAYVYCSMMSHRDP